MKAKLEHKKLARRTRCTSRFHHGAAFGSPFFIGEPTCVLGPLLWPRLPLLAIGAKTSWDTVTAPSMQQLIRQYFC
jgi:hypothetical protein